MNIKKNKIDILNILLKINAKLLNQGFNEKETLLLNIWALMTVVLVSCYSSNIRSSLIYQPMKTINNFEELIKSNISLVTGDIGFISASILQNSNDPMIKKIKNRTTFVNDWHDLSPKRIVFEQNLLRNVTKRKVSYIREGAHVDRLLLSYPHYAQHLAVAEERYFTTSIGYLLNMTKTIARLKIHIMYVIIRVANSSRFKSWRKYTKS